MSNCRKRSMSMTFGEARRFPSLSFRYTQFYGIHVSLKLMFGDMLSHTLPIPGTIASHTYRNRHVLNSFSYSSIMYSIVCM